MASRATTHACVAARSFCITCVRARHRQLSTGLLSLERFGVWLQSIEKVSMRQLQPWQLYYQLRIGAGHRRPSTALARTAGPYAQRGGCALFGRRLLDTDPKTAATAPAGRRLLDHMPSNAASAPAGRKLLDTDPRTAATAPTGRRLLDHMPSNAASAPVGRRLLDTDPRTAATAPAGRRL